MADEVELRLAGGGNLRYVPAWIPSADADALFETLVRELPLRQEHLTLFGRRVAQPRLSAWLGEPEARYAYSGLALTPVPWRGALRALADRLAAEGVGRFNGVLANLYRDGDDSMGLHADDEPELGQEPTIASVSLGAARRFVLKPRRGVPGEPVALELAHGSLLVMAGALQRDWVHGLPKSRRVRAPRLNLTFRTIRPVAVRAPGPPPG